LIHVHHGSIIVEIATIVLGRKDRNQLLVLSKETVTIFHDLMSSANQIEVMPLKEFFQLLSSEHKSAASLVLLPVSHVVVGVIP
jgi:hypothetical protein